MSVSSRLFSIAPKVVPLCAKATSSHPFPRSITALYTACRQTRRAFSTPSPSLAFAADNPSKEDRRVFFFDIDNCLYPKSAGIARLMSEKIQQYFRDAGIPHHKVEVLAHRYYIDYGLAIRGLIEQHPNLDISDYDAKVDGALPLEVILSENVPLREMILSMNVGKTWLFTNAGKTHAERVIHILGLEGLFEGTTYCNYLEPKFVCKPDHKAFEKAMREAGVADPGDCYFIDDSGPNIEMATKIGWNTVHLVDKKDPVLPRQLGHFQVHSPLDLPKVMPQFWK